MTGLTLESLPRVEIHLLRLRDLFQDFLNDDAIEVPDLTAVSYRPGQRWRNHDDHEKTTSTEQKTCLGVNSMW